mgnify:CR=1 FL=1
MKLLLCNSCETIVTLGKTTRTCQCGACGGHYKEDGVNAVYYGDATTIGFVNSEFKYAMDNRPRYGSGVEFTAFVIPDNVPTITQVDIDDYEDVYDSEDLFEDYDDIQEEADLQKKQRKLKNVFKDEE